jgi:hypothetical protein
MVTSALSEMLSPFIFTCSFFRSTREKGFSASFGNKGIALPLTESKMKNGERRKVHLPVDLKSIELD